MVEIAPYCCLRTTSLIYFVCDILLQDHRVRMPFPIAEFYKVLATRRKAEGRSSSSSTASSSKKEEDARATAKMDEVWVKVGLVNMKEGLGLGCC